MKNTIVKKFFLDAIQTMAKNELTESNVRVMDKMKSLYVPLFIQDMLNVLIKNSNKKEKEIWLEIEFYLHRRGKFHHCNYCNKELNTSNEENNIWIDPNSNDEDKYFCNKCVEMLKLDSIMDKNDLIKQFKYKIRTKENFDKCMEYNDKDWINPLIDITKTNKIKKCNSCYDKIYPSETIIREFTQGTFTYCSECNEKLDKEIKKDKVEKRMRLIEEDNQWKNKF